MLILSSQSNSNLPSSFLANTIKSSIVSRSSSREKGIISRSNPALPFISKVQTSSIIISENAVAGGRKNSMEENTKFAPQLQEMEMKVGEMKRALEDKNSQVDQLNASYINLKKEYDEFKSRNATANNSTIENVAGSQPPIGATAPSTAPPPPYPVFPPRMPTEQRLPDPIYPPPGQYPQYGSGRWQPPFSYDFNMSRTQTVGPMSMYNYLGTYRTQRPLPNDFRVSPQLMRTENDFYAPRNISSMDYYQARSSFHSFLSDMEKSFVANFDFNNCDFHPLQAPMDVTNNEDRFKWCCLKTKGVLYENPYIQIGFEIEPLQFPQFRVRLFYFNTSSSDFLGFSVKFPEPNPNFVIWVRDDLKDLRLNSYSQMMQEFTFTFTRVLEVDEMPTIQIKYKDIPDKIKLRLPMTVNRMLAPEFNKPHYLENFLRQYQDILAKQEVFINQKMAKTPFHLKRLLPSGVEDLTLMEKNYLSLAYNPLEMYLGGVFHIPFPIKDVQNPVILRIKVDGDQMMKLKCNNHSVLRTLAYLFSR